MTTKRDASGWVGLAGYKDVSKSAPTEFEREVKKLGLKPEQYLRSQNFLNAGIAL